MLNKIISLHKEIAETYENLGIISIDGFGNVHMRVDGFINLSAGQDVHVKKRDCETYPLEVQFTHDDMKFFIILSNKEYDEYKKATADTAAKESFDTQ